MARPHSFHLHSDVVDFDTDPQTYRKVILGDGGFAVVYRGRYCRDTPVAIKVLKSQDQQGQYERLRVKLVHEVEKWQGLTHGNILQFHGYITEPLAMVAEIADGGDLRQLLNRAIQQPGLLDRDGPRILLQIAKGMSYLHSRDVLHCDLKPENVVISGDVCRVSDFGLAAVRDAMGTEGGIPLGGTLGYIAPEVFANPPIRNKLSDVWSYGVIAFE
ncbi:kinase-like domain-containing protein, partial [Hyaloraphidium curvatum]